MSIKTTIRLAAVLAILTFAAQPAWSQAFVRPFFYEPYFPILPSGPGLGYGGYPGGFGYGGYPGYGGSYGSFSSSVYTPATYGSSTYYSMPFVITPGYGVSSGDSGGRVRSNLSSALAVPTDSPLLLAAWDAPTGDSRAAVVVVLPTAGARVWVQGSATNLTGTLRRFTTPPLNAEKLYEYDVQAQWMDVNGQWQTDSQTVQVRSGAVVNVVFAKKAP
jgi:uncharacterized protein (TIGR03000 family)